MYFYTDYGIFTTEFDLGTAKQVYADCMQSGIRLDSHPMFYAVTPITFYYG